MHRPHRARKALGGVWVLGLGSVQQECPRSASALGGQRTRSRTAAGSLGLSGQGKFPACLP